ncbi:MAG: rhomboid family intramembrane serine protease, partial [Bacteroidota bacterium]
MLRSLLEEEIQRFKMGNMVRRLIVVNVVVFILVNLVNLAFFLAFQFSSPDPGTFYPGSSYQKAYNAFIHFFSMSSSGWYVLTHPWTIITHMFLHEGFWHILWNMLFLYWFGRIVGDFIGNQKILPIYLLSGFAGAVMYFLGAAIFTNGLIAPFALGA